MAMAPTRPVALFDTPMIVLQMIIQVAVRPVPHPLPKDVPNSARIGIMAIRGDALWDHTGYRPGGTEKGLGRCKVACLAEPHIDQIPVAVDGTVEILPLTLNPHVSLVHIPTVANLAVAPFAQYLTQERGQHALPGPYGFMGKDHTSLEKHLCQVSQA